MNKKRAEQLEVLLDWEREGGRLAKNVHLFNCKIGDDLYLRETQSRGRVLTKTLTTSMTGTPCASLLRRCRIWARSTCQ